jgi:SAM-dependent methyltransferase
MDPTCFICHGPDFDHLTPQYRRCLRCGHETQVAPAPQTLMLNETLRADVVRRGSSLERFQGAVLDRVLAGRPRRLLVDIGSGSGKFLYRQCRRFRRHCGIEITPAAIEFSRRELGLTIATGLAAVDGEIDAATAWHSFEHFPAPALEAFLADLGAKMPEGARLVVSVPNGGSFQYRLFRAHYAFFDLPNHPQQFTADSLLGLLAAHGFVRTHTFVSWPYNVFGYAQGFLNLVMPEHNYAYQRLKRGTASRSLARDLAAAALLPFVAPIAALLALVDACCPAQQGVLTYGFEKRGSPA